MMVADSDVLIVFLRGKGGGAERIRRDLERAGRKIATADSLIAGICVSHRGVLLTRQRSHFERIVGLHLGTITEGSAQPLFRDRLLAADGDGMRRPTS